MWCEQALGMASMHVLVTKHTQFTLIFCKHLPRHFYLSANSGQATCHGEHHTKWVFRHSANVTDLKERPLVHRVSFVVDSEVKS